MLHEKILAEQIGAVIVPPKYNSMVNYENIILLAPHRMSELGRINKILKRYPKTRVLLWWVGTDVLALGKLSYKPTLNALRRMRAKNLAVSVGLQRELRSLGVVSDVLPLVPNVKHGLDIPLPEKYTVAVYMPAHKTSFYGAKQVKEIAKMTPDVDYILYGNKTPLTVGADNVECVGWVNGTENIINRANCILRYTDHDGHPKSLMEFGMCGRFLISNHEYKNVWSSSDIKEIADKINEHPVLTKEQTKWFREEYSVDGFKNKLSRYFI